MIWLDIASIVFVSVTVNHLGLVKAIEEVTEQKIPIVGCVKCLTFWAVLLYTIKILDNVALMLAISFLSSYVALWLELLEGYIDTLYMKFYEKIFTDTQDRQASTDA